MLKIPPHPIAAIKEDLSFSILQTCLIHYFSYPPVEKIVAIIDGNDVAENEDYGRAGFRLLCEIEGDKRLVYHHGKGYIDREGEGVSIPVNGW
jgi:hypothetical protein